MERRAADWQTIPGGNMDLERLEQEVLRPARAGEAVRYRPFDCQTGQLGDWVEKAPALLTVVEGSYSLHPALKVAYDARIFLTLESGEQERRLRAREGKHFAAFQTVWIPMEERYFQQCRTEAGSTLSLDTSAFDREL
jgi:hypothetical protein